MSSTIGFVGLGNMGGPMAANLVAAGLEVKVFDLVADLMDKVQGGIPQASALNAATDVDVFISMLPAGVHVAGLYLEQGVLDRLPKGALAIDCSTIDPGTAQQVAAAAADKGVAMLDAPVSGGTAGAQNGNPDLHRRRRGGRLGAGAPPVRHHGRQRLSRRRRRRRPDRQDLQQHAAGHPDGRHRRGPLPRGGQRLGPQGALRHHEAVLRRQLGAQCL